MKIRDLLVEGVLDRIKTSANKFWNGTDSEITHERRWPMAYEKSMVAYKNALNSGDFAAINKNSDLVNYFALLTGNPTLDSLQNRLLRQKWTKQDFVDYVKTQYAADLAKANSRGLEEAKAVWNKPNPKKNHKKLTDEQKSKAKERAKKAGRKYPNMVDNIRAAKN